MNMPLLLIAVLCCNRVIFPVFTLSICNFVHMDYNYFSQENRGANFNLLLSHNAVNAVFDEQGYQESG